MIRPVGSAHERTGSCCDHTFVAPSAGQLSLTATASAYSNGVDLPGISVYAQSGYSEETELRFDFTRATKFCGNVSSGLLNSGSLTASIRTG